MLSKFAFCDTDKFHCSWLLCLFQATDKYGITALLAAVYEGHRDCVETLLKHVSIVTGWNLLTVTKNARFQN